MLSEKEIERIFSWLPYREDWPVKENARQENIDAYFKKLTSSFLSNPNFNAIQMESGGMSNYIDFMSYHKGNRSYEGDGILVMVNLCAPIAAYGVTRINVSEKTWGNSGLQPEEVGLVNATELKEIENHITDILLENGVEMIDHHLASKTLPKKVYDSLDLPFSDKYLYGLFQMSS